MGFKDNRLPRSKKDNTGNTTDLLKNAGDILINNAQGTTTRLSIGQEDQQLTVSNGVPTWKYSYGERMNINYYSYPESTAWSATYGANGVPFSEDSLSKYDHAYKIFSEFLTLQTVTGAIIHKSTNTQGGYTTGNITTFKNNCQELHVTVSSGSATDIALITDNLGTTGATAITTISDFVSNNSLSGVDIDFEDFGNWDATLVTNLNTWLGSLKTSVNNAGGILNISLPYIGNATIASAYNFDYSTFINNVDTLTIMCYDVHLDYTYSYSICPLEMLVGGTYNDINNTDDVLDLQGSTSFYQDGVLGKFSTDNSGNHFDKLIIGLPAYGFVHDDADGLYTVTNGLTRNSINFSGPDTRNGLRDQGSELRWHYTSGENGYTYVFCDGVAMRSKAESIRKWLNKFELDNPTKSKPLYEISIYHMGGNNYSFYE